MKLHGKMIKIPIIRASIHPGHILYKRPFVGGGHFGLFVRLNQAPIKPFEKLGLCWFCGRFGIVSRRDGCCSRGDGIYCYQGRNDLYS